MTTAPSLVSQAHVNIVGQVLHVLADIYIKMATPNAYSPEHDQVQPIRLFAVFPKQV